MPYRDELDAARTHLETVTAELDEANARLERARAALASAVADMAGLPAKADIPWRSLHGGEPQVVRFVNESERKLELVWVSYDGQERPSATLIPGGERDEPTFVAHLWRLIDRERGEVVAQRYVRAEDPRIVAR